MKAVVTRLACVGIVLAAQAVAAQTMAVTPVPSFDRTRYLGRWFEIARYPNWFQKKCVGDTTAEYALRDDGRISVTNRCRRADGTMDEAVGVARPRDAEHPEAAMLKVRFAPSWLSFVPQVWGDYWILALPADYRYAVIGEPSRKYLWILSRTPRMSEADYAAAVAAAVQNGYDAARLVQTPQSAP